MSLAYDVRANLLLLVDLLNSAPHVTGPDDGLASVEQLTEFVTQHGFTGPLGATPHDVAVAAGLRERFTVALANDVEPVVAAINLTFSEIRAFPRLASHGDWGWHMHATADSAPLGERMASDLVFALTDLIRFGDLPRLRSCAAEDCTAALADLTRNQSKRFCDARNCANRTHIAAYRARRNRGVNAEQQRRV
ncbi:putative stress-induced transcription regulator [Leucobacter luti]|uniref:Putative stress-induced transcription regulator n=1 Tax=Leucobacter luti TaxID=340320 RepID=A0A4V3CXU1_9MICO|nr:CGNR zinc finger domain-containing protein [Leucobacter luti]TDP91568.1 putative stress-induced transcription regulator [Leucobacter luti]